VPFYEWIKLVHFLLFKKKAPMEIWEHPQPLFCSCFVVKGNVAKLRRKQLIVTFVRLWLTEADAQVYVFLAANDPQKARDAATALEIRTPQAYRILKRLHSKGIFRTSNLHPFQFCAVPLEEVVDLFLKVKKEEGTVH
jgi:hypothetical protein